MSMSALRWARSVRSISSTQKLVLWALADSANDYGEAWPSALLLAEDCCLGDRAVRMALDDLERAGLIVGERRLGHATRWIVQVGSTPAGNAGGPAGNAEGPARDAGGARQREFSSEPRHEMPRGSAPDAGVDRRDPGTSCRGGRHEMPGGGRHLVPGGSASGADRTPKNPHNNPKEPKARAPKRRRLDLPPWLPADAWTDWVAYRRSQKGWTDKAAELSLRELGKLADAGHDPRKVIEQSIRNGWRGLFPSRDGGAPRVGRASQADTIADLMRDPFERGPSAAFDFDGTAEEHRNV